MTLLPIIKKKTVKLAVKEMVSARVVPGHTMERLAKENPQFEEAVCQVARNGNYINADSILIGAMIAYRLLEIQAEADKKNLRRLANAAFRGE
jgi:hypothetical protein